jgi:hypothetical protein
MRMSPYSEGVSILLLWLTFIFGFPGTVPVIFMIFNIIHGVTSKGKPNSPIREGVCYKRGNVLSGVYLGF